MSNDSFGAPTDRGHVVGGIRDLVNSPSWNFGAESRDGQDSEFGAERLLENFADLTLLYPQLQVQGRIEVPVEDARQATLAHACLLIHAFLEDRLLDEQARPSRSLTLVCKSTLLEGLRILHSLGPRELDTQAVFHDLFAEYFGVQFATYIDNEHTTLDRERVCEIASGRAVYGAIGVMALLHSAGCDDKDIVTARKAFDALVTGLQWIDDLDDWREDLAIKDENLLLCSLRLAGPDPYEHEDNEVRDVNVGHALCEYGIFDKAATEAEYWFALAAAEQRSLECHALADMIDARKSDVADRVKRVRTEVEEDIQLRMQSGKSASSRM